jgi:hypothetical protein
LNPSFLMHSQASVSIICHREWKVTLECHGEWKVTLECASLLMHFCFLLFQVCDYGHVVAYSRYYMLPYVW